jgi:thiamine-monophosphate kinase
VTPSVREVGELALIRSFRQRATADSGVLVGIGDDTAVLEITPGAVLLATTDLLVEDIHFRRLTASPYDIGWKAVAVNLSDIAAMGGTPRWALVALALPDSAEVDAVDACYRGMLDAARPHVVSIVGGDTSSSPAGWTINVTLLGEHSGMPRLRSMGRAGDAIAVTGTVGRSAAGLEVLEIGAPEATRLGLAASALDELAAAHLRPSARVQEGRWLGAQASVHAMMDCSDGLATDVAHVCRESRLGARLRVDALPVSPAAREAARALGRDATAWAASGGEDYELLVTCEAAAVRELARGLLEATGTALTVIGELTAGAPDVAWVNDRGEPVAVAAGYEHFHE